jgi:hypothetical protein
MFDALFKNAPLFTPLVVILTIAVVLQEVLRGGKSNRRDFADRGSGIIAQNYGSLPSAAKMRRLRAHLNNWSASWPLTSSRALCSTGPSLRYSGRWTRQ